MGDCLEELRDDVVEIGLVGDGGEQLRSGGLQPFEADVDALAPAFDQAVGVGQQDVSAAERQRAGPRGTSPARGPATRYR